MLELEDKLNLYGFGIEEVSKVEEQYHEYKSKFTDNRLYQEAVSELTQEIFERFANSSEEEAMSAHYEIVALKKIVARMKSYEDEYLKIQAIKETNDGMAETY